MPWSTSQLAQLAGTTIKAVREYHEIRLLDHPPRSSNGYEQYDLSHLLRLLQITRLVERGVPLAQIATLDRAEGDAGGSTGTLGSEFDRTAECLRRLGGELALTWRHRTRSEVPPGSGESAADFPVESLLEVFARGFVDSAMDELARNVAEEPHDDAGNGVPPLGPGPDRGARERLRERLEEAIGQQLAGDRSLGAESPGVDCPV